MPDYPDFIYHYPNIAAFQITEATKENIANIFLSLILKWQYFPKRKQIRIYHEIFKKHYSAELCEIFEEAIKMNYLNLRIDYEVSVHDKIKN